MAFDVIFITRQNVYLNEKLMLMCIYRVSYAKATMNKSYKLFKKFPLNSKYNKLPITILQEKLISNQIFFSRVVFQVTTNCRLEATCS